MLEGSGYYINKFTLSFGEASIKYNFIEGAKQEYVINKDDTATFRINADFNLFTNGGAVYVDSKLVSPKNYTAKSGSTIIIFSKNYLNTLSAGSHNLKVVFNNGGVAETTFTVSNQNASTSFSSSNPQTLDNILNYVVIFILSIMSLVSSALYLNKES